PWESAGDGVDVTPSMGRDRSGRVFPIRTGQLEEHVVADVAWAAATYMDWTHDEDFIHGPGRTLLVETARYWASRVRVTPDGRGHLFGVTGPDEYHEPVDDNAFTNVMARWNLRRAAGSCADLDGEEVDRWRRTADALVDNYQDDSGLYEQFSGFWRLEPLVIADLAPKRPIAAELLLGRDRVRRAQVVKQADVLMMHHMVPGEVAAGSLEPNLEFYEPRTAHGSSLSPGVHASLFARAGQMSDAVRALHLASRLDLDDLTGTTAAGLHVATMGSVWQAMVYGFAGVRPAGNALRIDPHIPPVWKSFEINLRFRGTPVRIVTTMDGVTVTGTGVRLQIGDGPIVECGSDGVALERSAEGWKVSDHGEDHRGDR
ncbi:MAG TPA: glycosyl hydrolase family 65 protein, partial [Actinomycetota bacterium]|nr:glycosyl hydrolase family 65 protein [Actinomycetota bacterium]